MTTRKPPGHLTKEQSIYLYLHEQIIDGELKPGDRLILREIAQETGVSEIPVREALKRLESDGLVVNRPHTGAVVKTLSREELVELFELRVATEALAARQAAVRASKKQLGELKKLVRLMTHEAALDDLDECVRLQRRFLQVLSEACGNRYLSEINHRLTGITQTRELPKWDPERAQRTISENGRIVELLERRDSEAVEDAVRRQRRELYDAVIAAYVPSASEPGTAVNGGRPGVSRTPRRGRESARAAAR